jgi:hypothetical protein
VGLCNWPIPRPRNWVGLVNAVQMAVELDALRRSVRRGGPFGDEVWQPSTASDSAWSSRWIPEGDRERNNERPREPTKWDLSPFPLPPLFHSATPAMPVKFSDKLLIKILATVQRDLVG